MTAKRQEGTRTFCIKTITTEHIAETIKELNYMVEEFLRGNGRD